MTGDWGWGCASAVRLLERGFRRGRAGCCCWVGEVRAGEAGGVWVEARGRVPSRESSRVASPWLACECRCRFLKKLMPRWTPVGRGAGESVERAVGTAVGGAGAAVVVNITFPLERRG